MGRYCISPTYRDELAGILGGVVGMTFAMSLSACHLPRSRCSPAWPLSLLGLQLPHPYIAVAHRSTWINPHVAALAEFVLTVYEIWCTCRTHSGLYGSIDVSMEHFPEDQQLQVTIHSCKVSTQAQITKILQHLQCSQPTHD